MNDAHARLLDQLDLNLFRVFDVVYRERSLARAAGVLSLTQSAISHALARLRRKLGDPLFFRQGRGVEPTPRAIQLASPVRQALETLERAVVRDLGFDPARDLKRVAVGIPDELEPAVIPELYERLSRVAPGSRLVASRLDRARLRADLASGRIDAALDVAHIAPEDVSHARLFTDSYCVVTGPEHRQMDRDTYFSLGHVAVSSRRTGPVLEDFGLVMEGLERRVAVRCQRYATAFRIVANSDLVLTIPRSFAPRSGNRPPLSVFDLPVAIAGVEVHLFWHASRDGDPVILWLREEIRRSLARSEFRQGEEDRGDPQGKAP